MATYKVVAGDCLWNIAASKLGNGSRWTEIANLNNIPTSNPIIYVGQVLELPSGGGTTTVTTNKTYKPTIEYFGLQAGSDRTIFAVWKFDNTNTDHFETVWEYDVGNKKNNGDTIWFVGQNGNVNADVKQDTYNAPANAIRARFKVKPVAKTKKAGDTETYIFTGSWSTIDAKPPQIRTIYNFSDNPPSKLSAPSVTVKGLQLTAEYNNLQNMGLDNGGQIEFQVLKDNANLFNTGFASVVTYHASYSCTLEAGSVYKVRCRGVRDGMESDWSEYSDNYSTPPSVPESITTIKSMSKTSVYLEWTEVTNAKTYDIEYATKITYFDGSNQTTTTSGIEFTHYELGGLATGEEYFFRVRAVNEEGDESGWSEIKSVAIGTTPVAPTTWSSTTTAVTGELLNLYWIHNTEDGSDQTYAEVELIIDGVSETQTIRAPEKDEDDPETTSVYSIDTTEFVEGTKILWRVRTAGVTLTYGDWSIQRTVDVYAPPTLSMNVENSSGDVINTIEEFPFYIDALAGPKTQSPIGYYLTVTANESYETVDELGNVKMVSSGDTVYSKYFDITSALHVQMSADNIDLENNIPYTVSVQVTMNSGLTAEATSPFMVSWTDLEYEPNAEIGFDKSTYAAYIRPYCEDEEGNKIPDISLSVYRREFDGSFMEIATGLDNVKDTFVTDPHPSLDFARYRIVAIDNNTGAVSYCDVPGYPVGEKSVIIQWAEDWEDFDVTEDGVTNERAWTGSLLRLTYNIDVSDKNNRDVSMINYVGRKRPVAYYGTQLGETATWNVSIPKTDVETLYALRRLSIWMGDVYVREPSGSGYWANVNVSFSQKHKDLTIPVTFDITRVEGGI